MQPTYGATTTANPSLVVVDMESLIRHCEALMAEHDGELVRLAAGVETLHAQMASVRTQRQEAADTRAEALRIQETLLSATQAGVALRSGQRRGTAQGEETPEAGRQDASGTADADPAPTDAPAAEETPLTAETDPPVPFDTSNLGPRGTRALQIITSTPAQQWTPKLLAVQLEGPEAAADQKAHNRARALMDDLAKKQFVVKKYQKEATRLRCYYVAPPAAEVV
ncbi:hypothetical protein [Streptomyces sp. NPDC006785]|uniref:hypothetical protein n=1 Tax=Streptomyces sp. NPDC006785 TaxID=3155461 RepID=UPI0033C3B98E